MEQSEKIRLNIIEIPKPMQWYPGELEKAIKKQQEKEWWRKNKNKEKYR